jgi:hypothetical protein
MAEGDRQMKRATILVLALAYVLGVYSFASRERASPTWADARFYPVESSVFDAARYDGASRTLTLLFRSGHAYEYYGVSRKTWLTFMRVKYKGSFFNAHIRRAYECKQTGWAP